MTRETPVITIDFEEGSAAYTIEELTFNPYISIERTITQEVSEVIHSDYGLHN